MFRKLTLRGLEATQCPLLLSPLAYHAWESFSRMITAVMQELNSDDAVEGLVVGKMPPPNFFCLSVSPK